MHLFPRLAAHRQNTRRISIVTSSNPDNKPVDPAATPVSLDQGGGARPEETNVWPLEADRLAIHSPLVECLRLLAGHYGRRTSTQSLIAGLPIPKAGITPALFLRAAERADLAARVVDRSLEALAIVPTLPCVLVLGGNQACILWDVKWPAKHPPKKEPGQAVELHPETEFVVQFPEAEEQRYTLPLARLREIYAGYAFFIRPTARSDDRAGPAEIDTARDWFWGTLKKSRRIYQEVVLAAVMINIFALASPLYVMNVYDRVVPNAAWSTLWVLSAGVFVVYLFDFVIKGLRAHFLDIAGRKADVKISAQLFEQMMGMTMQARPASAGVLASNMREFEGLRDFFTSATMVALIDMPFTILFILLVAVIGGPIALIPLVAVPIVIGFGYALQRPLQKITRESLNESALKNALLFETISGLETIKMQAAEGNVQRKWEELTEKSSGTAVKMRRLSAFALNFSMLIQQIVSIFVVVLGVWLITEGQISMGALIACVMLTGRAMAPLTQVAGLLTRMNQSREALRQLDDMMKKPVERPAGKHFIPMPGLAGKVEFRDVVFHYPGQTVPALKNVQFTVGPGEKVGIIGAVGSGKTTLERLLLNLYQPDSGSVQIDGADVRQIDPGDLRRSVGAVQQSPQLFYGSVRENITMGHEMAPEKAVLRAAELSGVMEFLRDSQHGLDTQVGERGEALSGGQRQAVAIARALLYDPPILILDEPTASMDPASENRLRKRLQELCKTKTTILITHKGSMLGLIDKLILMDRGKIVDYGPKDDIIRKLQARQYGTSAEQTDV
jgi:ATP-binding cassette subfamily C protein LapB